MTDARWSIPKKRAKGEPDRSRDRAESGQIGHNGTEKPAPSPEEDNGVFKGGQGRSAEEIEGKGKTLGRWALILIAGLSLWWLGAQVYYFVKDLLK